MQYSSRSGRNLLFSACFAILVSLSLLSAPAAFSQGITTGTITGTTIDPQGAVIPGASVKATDTATGATFVSVSGGDGSYSLRDLPIGSYTLIVSASGFSSLKVDAVLVTAGNTNALGKEALTVGANSAVVEVESREPLLQTTESQVSETFTTEQLQDLPLNNGFDEVALLMPGVVQTHDNSFSNSNGASFSSNGTRGRDNNFELDGQSNNDNSVGGPQVFFGNQDAIAELQVVTNQFSAQYGRNSGSVVNYITKSGTNAFHGSAFEFWTGSTFESLENSQKNPELGYCTPGEDPNATGCAPVDLPRYVENKFGGTFGGPILKDRLWFFGSGYFDRTRYGGGNSVSGLALTPNAAGLTLLSTTFPTNPGVAALVNSGPYSIKTGNPTFYGPVVTQPVTVGGTTIQVPFQAISRSVPSLINDEELMGKMDWAPTTKDHLFARYFYQDDPDINAGGSVAAGAWYNVPDTAHSVGADWTHSFSTNWIDQLRYSFQQTSLTFQSGAIPGCTIETPGNCTSSVGISGSFADDSGNSYTNLGYGYPDNIPQGRIVKTSQVQDNASWVKGKHSINFGGEYDYQNSPNGFLPNYGGTYTYDNFANVLSGATTLSLADGNYKIPFTESDYALYFQDDWKVSPRLTLNLGLRWEFFGQAINLLHNETVAAESNAATALWDPTLPLSERTVPKANSNYKNFEPRVGFAYQPAFNSKLVFRGGFAINFDPAFYNLFLDIAEGAPVANAGAITCDGVTVVCQSTAGASSADTRAIGLPLIPLGGDPNARKESTVAPNFSNPYTESYNLGIGYQVGNHLLFDAHYAGNHVVKNFQSLNDNPDLSPVASVYPNIVNPSTLCSDPNANGFGRLDCERSNVRRWGNTAFSQYNGLQLRAEAREFHNFSGTINYTWSRTIDNTSEVFSTLGGGNSVTFAQNPLNVSAGERGESGISIPNVLAIEASYKLPLFSKVQNNLRSKILGGFQMNGIYQHDDGQPATPYQTYYNQNTVSSGLAGSFSLSDEGFLNNFLGPYDNYRPIISNVKAPLNSVGYYLTSDQAVALGGKSTDAGWYDYRTGAAISGPSAVHWIHNDLDDQTAIGATTPYDGAGRSILRATHFSKLDTSIYKTTQLTERISLQLQITAFNVLNQQFYGTPDPEIEDPSFQTPWYSTGSNRNLQFGGKIRF